LKNRIIRTAVGAILLYCGYFLASHHIIIIEKDFTTLPKNELTFEYTFYNLTGKDPEDVLEIDMLRDAGIGDLLVELEWLTEDERQGLERQYD
jgi:hypothetical protein